MGVAVDAQNRASGSPDHLGQDHDLQAAHDLQLEVIRLISRQLTWPRTHETLQQGLPIENLVEDA
ncbi:hypothetical protein ACFWHQ_34560 [Streptomyces sp. NPDC060334]|uniref:hypothetical protein n=1 Tax=unclassified Streptomyces TaxID=2593676 RepID=UPI0036650BB4